VLLQQVEQEPQMVRVQLAQAAVVVALQVMVQTLQEPQVAQVVLAVAAVVVEQPLAQAAQEYFTFFTRMELL
jgi:hypothetical protein